MIVFINVRGHERSLRSLVQKRFGVPTPEVRQTNYETIFGRWSVPRATYVFIDLDRLAPWELRVASELYRSMSAAGLRCLNDPARAMSRGELLINLYAEELNPFAVARADERPKPGRFPVFLRQDDNHVKAEPDLLHGQAELDRALDALMESGVPLRGILVVEQCAEAYAENLWVKWGSWRIGERIITEHLVADDTWLVKTGDHAKQSSQVIADEHDAVANGRFDKDIKERFDVAHIEFGRADHATVGGRTVIYEINTNPFLSALGTDPDPLRSATRILARKKIAAALEAIDTPESGRVVIASSESRRPIRWWRPGFRTPRRP